ncbi:hypothetical protein [Ammoniphilus sp. YIM 78166]|uniref:hypothetical protein n=1 Tax=Ammoniphilus sp. YIM 78166 TaxID=1644106 RepID=UPI0010702F2E|nr:hypothetical protein [Ammoniphilus sp. YIM 78166]
MDIVQEHRCIHCEGLMGWKISFLVETDEMHWFVGGRKDHHLEDWDDGNLIVCCQHCDSENSFSE